MFGRCMCVCFYLFIIKSYKHSKNIFILLEGRETPSIPMHTISFSLFFSPLLLHLSLLFLCPQNSLLDPLYRWFQKIKPRWNFKGEKFLGFCSPCWHAIFSLIFQIKALHWYRKRNHVKFQKELWDVKLFHGLWLSGKYPYLYSLCFCSPCWHALSS